MPSTARRYTFPLIMDAYEPGDATRYELVLAQNPRGYLFAWTNSIHGVASMTLGLAQRCPHPSTIAEKMGVNDYDASVLATWLDAAIDALTVDIL